MTLDLNINAQLSAVKQVKAQSSFEAVLLVSLVCLVSVVLFVISDVA